MFAPLFFRPLWKALLALLATTCLVLAWSTAELERAEERHLAEIMPPRAALCGRALARVLRDEPAQARSELLELARRGAMHVAWLDGAGRVRADSNPGEGGGADLSALPEVRAVLGGSAHGFAFDVGRGHAASVVPLEDVTERGYLRLSQPLLALERRQDILRLTLFSGAAGLALLLAWILARNARRIARDALRLARQAESIAGGDTPRRMNLADRSALAPLVPPLQRLSDGLGARIETLAQDRNQLRAILASMIEGVVAVDTHGIVLHSNAVAGEILRVPPALARGRRLRETTRVREVSELLEHVLETGESAEREAALPGLGEPRVVQLRASALEDARGTRAGAVVVIHDISALRRLEDMRREFVANVSHELKTPLTAIQGFVETILGDPDMPESLRQRFLERIQAQSERLYLLVQDLLALARIEAQSAALELAPIDPRPALQRALDTMQPTAEARGIAVRAEIEDPAPQIDGEPGAVEQIATNLLDNAIKYSRANGQVALRFFARGNDAILEVEDDGIGIEERHQRRIFERFYRVDKARSRDVGGTGLGLAIVKHLSLALGGEVGVRSQLGQGSTFTVRLPRTSP